MTHDPREALKRADTDFEFIRETLVHCLNEPERTAFWKAVSARDRCREALSAAPGEPVALGDLPTVPDDDADFTPDLARKIILKYQEMICALTASAPKGEPDDLTWFWQIVDSEGFEGVPSDERDALSRIMNELRRLRTSPPPAAGWDEAQIPALVEIAWNAIVGSDIGPNCYNAAIVRGDIETALRAVFARHRDTVATKKTYIKPLRTIVEIDARYADQIRDLLNDRREAPASSGVACAPELEPWRDELSEIIGHLGSAIVQSCDKDDQIIMDHVKAAHEIAKIVRRKADV